jgi:hypothetical protein
MVAAALAVLALALPQHGVVVPSKSFGGLPLGATQAQVRAAWGSRYGLCRSCPQTTWYYTYRKFDPKGVAVSFERGRAVAFFTLWSPLGWRTSEGLRVGQLEASAGELYGVLPRTECGTYAALVLRRGRADLQIYLVGGKVWGLGLSSAGVPACH